MNIDMHFHMIPPFFLEEVRGDNPWGKRLVEENGELFMQLGPLKFPMLANHYDTAAILAAMDEMRLDVTAISPSPMLFHNHLPGEVVFPLHQGVNDHMAEMARAYPDRFRPLGIVPMQTPELALAEVERIFEMGLAGIEIETNIAGVPLDAGAFWPVYEKVQDHSGLIFLHPAQVLGMDRLRDYYLANLIGNPTDTAAAVAHLIFGGVMEAHPELQIVLPHGGGSTPCLCGRWDHGSRVRPELTHMQTLPGDQVKKFYFDSLTHSDASLSLLLEVVGADRVVLGSDHPYDMGEMDPVGIIEGRHDLSPEQKSAILGGTAGKLLGMDR